MEDASHGQEVTKNLTSLTDRKVRDSLLTAGLFTVLTGQWEFQVLTEHRRDFGCLGLLLCLRPLYLCRVSGIYLVLCETLS